MGAVCGGLQAMPATTLQPGASAAVACRCMHKLHATSARSARFTRSRTCHSLRSPLPPQANSISCSKLVQLVAEAYKVSCLACSPVRLMAAEFVCGAAATRQSINV